MSSVGQVVGGIVGGVIGFFAGGNVMLGASIGMAIGGYIDPPPGQNVVGPRLEDLTVQTSTYGAVLPRIKGTVAVTGNVFWLEGDRIVEHTKTEKVGGKGAPSSTSTTYSYSATFAIGLAHCITAPVSGIKRLWLGNTLVYDAGATDLESVIASNLQAGVAFKFYDGRDDQLPDPRMQADKGVANVSGYPGRAFIVFYDLDLTEHYNNSLMMVQAKVELVCGNPGTPSHYTAFTTQNVGYLANNGFTSKVVSAASYSTSIDYAVSRLDDLDNLYGFEYYTAKFGEYLTKTSTIELEILSGYGHTAPGILIVQHNRDGALHAVVSQGLYLTYQTVFWFVSNGTITSSRAYTDAEVSYGYYKVCACDAGYTFMVDTGTGRPPIKFDGANLSATASVSVRASAIALSESNVFVSAYASGPGAVTVHVFDRETLGLVASHTQSVNGNGAVAFHVISDTEFYLAADQSLSHWVGGVATSLGSVMDDPAGSYPYRQIVVFKDPDYFIEFSASSGNYEMAGVLTNFPISAQSAKLRDIVTEECALAGIQSSDLDLNELVDSDVRGYRASSAGSVRTILEQLQAAFPFDVIQSGYKLKFKSRGSASVLTVPEDDLGAHTGNDTPSRFMLTTEMPSQVPAKVTFNFLNADREYDPDEQAATFTAQEVKNSYAVSLPLVMTPTEAQRAADVLLKKEQIERTSCGTFWLPQLDAYRKLEAADVIDVIANGRTHTIRLVKVTQLPDGRVECDGKMTASAAYTSSAEAQDSLVLGQSGVPLAGSTEMVLLDIPRIVSDQDVFGLSVAMYGYTNSWPGGVAMRSDDSGESYNVVSAFGVKSDVFIAGSPIGAADGYAVDSSSILTVTPAWSGADLYSITETQLYAHLNLAAYGADGRWEIVCFKTVTASSGAYVLQDFLRGLYGTEWASGLHVSGDVLVMLDINAADFIGMPISALNSQRLWRCVTSGAAIDSAPDITQTCAGVSLKPLAPVDISGWRNPVTLDFTISCVRRSRWPVELLSGSSVPLGESSESYEMEIWNSDYSTLIRTITGMASPSAVWTQAQQIADFGDVQQIAYVRFYQISSVVGRGFPLQKSVSRVLGADPLFDKVVLLLHMEGANNGTTFTDQLGHAFSAFGTAVTSTTQFKYGSSSGSFPGSTSYISTPAASNLAMSNSDFTIEAWVYPTSLSSNGKVCGIWSDTTGVGFSYRVYVTSTGAVQFSWSTNGSNAATITSSAGVVSTNTWSHIAVVRSGNTVYFFANGVACGSSAMSDTLYTVSTSKSFEVGRDGAGPSAYFVGYIDEVRITKAPRYSGATYTVPTAAFPNG